MKLAKAGTYMGDFITRQYEVKGKIFFVGGDNGNQIRFENFYYNGKGPDAYIYVGTDGNTPSGKGIHVNYPAGTNKPLGKYENAELTFTIPFGAKNHEVKWVSIWCKKFAVNFGELIIEKGAPISKTLKGDLTSRSYGVSGKVFFLGGDDGNQIQLENFNYNGKGPDAFIYVGTSGDAPSGSGMKIQYPAGSDAKLNKFENSVLKFTLPSGTKNRDVKWISIWCKQYSVNFGELMIKDNETPSNDVSTEKSESTTNKSDDNSNNNNDNNDDKNNDNKDGNEPEEEPENGVVINFSSSLLISFSLILTIILQIIY